MFRAYCRGLGVRNVFSTLPLSPCISLGKSLRGKSIPRPTLLVQKALDAMALVSSAVCQEETVRIMCKDSETPASQAS